MAWEEELFALFDDLESQAEALHSAERDIDVAERSRAEYAQVTLASRLMASVGHEVTLRIVGVGPVSGDLVRVAADWCLLQRAAIDWVVPLAAVVTVQGVSPRSVPQEAWSPLSRLGLGSALRRIAESGERCVVHLVDGSQADGTLERVGHDFVEVRADGGSLTHAAFAGVAGVRARGAD